MPEGYVKMRDAFIRQGLSSRIAKQKAARIYNAKRGMGVPPITPSIDKMPGTIDNRDNRDNRGMGD